METKNQNNMENNQTNTVNTENQNKTNEQPQNNQPQIVINMSQEMKNESVQRNPQMVKVRNKDKTTAALLAIFLGWLGAHKFYLGKAGLGIVYILFYCITWFVGIIEGICMLCMDEKEFDLKYNYDWR
jgi:TM2 domain-containing membrane protein YozV